MGESPTEKEQPRRWPRRLRVALYIIATLAAADLAAMLVAGLMLRSEVSRLRAGGYLPPTAQIVPQVPSGQANAADIYLLAFDARRPRDSEETDLVNGRPDRWRPADLLHARQVLAANAEHFRILDQASRIPGCAFPVDWNAGPAMLFPHLGELRRSARLLSTRAAVAARDQRIDDALADCATMLRIAEHVKCEPIVISMLVAYPIQDMAVQSVRNALSTGTPSPKVARDLLGQLSAIGNREPFIRAVRGEIGLFGMEIFDIARRGGKEAEGLFGSPDARILSLYGSILRPLGYLDEIAYLRGARRSADAVALPWPKSKEQLEAADEWAKELPAYRSLLTQMALPSWSRALETCESRTAELRAAQIGLALVIYKSEHGAYPDTLASLEATGPKLPADPFTQKPFQYRRRGDGFIVYSLGPDMRDEGGRPMNLYAPHLSREEAKKLSQEYDIPFRVPR
jgi:hypothetical protein